MSIDELQAHAEHQLELAPEIDFMVLELPVPWRPPPKFPRGETLCHNSRGNQVKRFSARKVLAWCKWAREEAKP